MTAISHRISNYCFRGVSPTPLVAFRLIFGALMLFGILRFMLKGWVNELYIEPDFHFTYLGFSWVQPLVGSWMYLPFILMVIASLGIILGMRYRLSAILFFVCFTYVELLDKANYLNHYYFVSLVSFIMCWLPAHVDFSVDARLHPTIRRETIPAWTVLIIQLQLGIVYFFAGIAKLNSDWLFHAQPLKTWLQAYRDLPLVGNLFATSWLAFAFSWFGCIYDLTIPFFLSFRKTRSIAYFFVIVFHIVTWLLFPIGVFPWVMIFSTLIFFPASFHTRWIQWLKKICRWKEITLFQTRKSIGKKIVLWGFGIYLTIQVVVPLRYTLYPGNLFWTEEGFRFSWRVMLMHKEGYATFYVVDRTTNNSIQIENATYLTPVQIDQMATQPDMILQFAHHLENVFNDTLISNGEQSVHLKNPAIQAEVFVSLNGRPHQLYIRRTIDLTNETYTLKHRTWLEQFKESNDF